VDEAGLAVAGMGQRIRDGEESNNGEKCLHRLPYGIGL
jgi:hypothetical protein